MQRSTISALGLISLIALWGLSAEASPLSPADQGRVNAAARYLEGLRSAQARFTQTDPRGAVTSGVFSLKRPGRARFAYDPPTGLTVVADGVNVDVYDAKLKTFSAYPIKKTPLSMLLGQSVRFDPATVVSVDHEVQGFSVTLRDPKRDAGGRLALNFSASPVTLTGWTVTDAQGLKTSVRLADVKNGAALSPDLFILKAPRQQAFQP